MGQIITAPVSCRFAALGANACEGEFCAYDFPACESCPRSTANKLPKLEDPMKSLIWCGWINGIAGLKK